jgi:hypothetical protein
MPTIAREFCVSSAGHDIAQELVSRPIYPDPAESNYLHQSCIGNGPGRCRRSRAEIQPPRSAHLTARINLADEVEGGLFDTILVDALNAALAVQLTRLCGDPAAANLAPSNGLSQERLKQVYDYVEEHIHQRLSLTDLAEVSCLSPYHFSRSFKQAVGIGPHHYITQRRLERAKMLMRRTNCLWL